MSELHIISLSFGVINIIQELGWFIFRKEMKICRAYKGNPPERIHISEQNVIKYPSSSKLCYCLLLPSLVPLPLRLYITYIHFCIIFLLKHYSTCQVFHDV